MSTQSAQKSGGNLWTNPKVLAGAGGGVLLVIVLAVVFWPKGEEKKSKKRGKAEDTARKVAPLVNPKDVPLPATQVATLTVETEEPGFFVLLNDEPVRTREGRLVRTPCEVTTSKGNYNVKIVKHGYQEQSMAFVPIGRQEKVSFTSAERTSDGTTTGALAKPYFEAEVGVPIALTSLNSNGRELDPFLEPDGLTIWFVSTRPSGQGVYSATRKSIYDTFDEPVFHPESQGSGLPATPSLSGGKWTGMVYVAPERGRIMVLTLDDLVDVGLQDKDHLLVDEDGGANWPSSQILENGLELYFAADEKGSRRTYKVTRKDLKRSFERAPKQEITLPGVHPCLSPDGLRQYVFDGRRLERARRGDLNSSFSSTELVKELGLTNYVPDPSRRQYFISADEQWLIYSNDPQRNADLYMVRISNGKGWGMSPVGKELIPDEPEVAVVPKEENPIKPADNTPKVDPRTLPLPYATFRSNFVSTMQSGDYQQAITAVDAAMKEPAFAEHRQSLAWDKQEAEEVVQFWKQAREAFRKLTPGTEIRTGTLKVKFQKFENDTIFGTFRDEVKEKKLQDLTINHTMAVVDETIPADDVAGQYRVAMFMFYHPEGRESAVAARLKRAGQLGEQFNERRAERMLKLTQQEIDRENASRALAYIGTLLTTFSDTPAAKTAQELKEHLYTLTKWIPAGREWTTGTPGMYQAPLARVENAHLKSPDVYRNFELNLEFKTDPPFGQGGVYFHYPGEGDIFERSYKLHLASDNGQPADAVSTGSLYKIAPPIKNAVKPTGQWNTLKLRVQGPNVLAFINGEKVLETRAEEMLDPDNPPPEDRQKGKSGHVILDGEVGGVTYRQILLVELPDLPSQNTPEPEPKTEEPGDGLLLKDDPVPDE